MREYHLLEPDTSGYVCSGVIDIKDTEMRYTLSNTAITTIYADAKDTKIRLVDFGETLIGTRGYFQVTCTYNKEYNNFRLISLEPVDTKCIPWLIEKFRQEAVDVSSCTPELSESKAIILEAISLLTQDELDYKLASVFLYSVERLASSPKLDSMTPDQKSVYFRSSLHSDLKKFLPSLRNLEEFSFAMAGYPTISYIEYCDTFEILHTIIKHKLNLDFKFRSGAR